MVVIVVVIVVIVDSFCGTNTVVVVQIVVQVGLVDFLFLSFMFVAYYYTHTSYTILTCSLKHNAQLIALASSTS